MTTRYSSKKSSMISVLRHSVLYRMLNLLQILVAIVIGLKINVSYVECSNLTDFNQAFRLLNNVSVQFNPFVNATEQTLVQESSKEVTETQHATCHIITERLAATARATVTRALKGICNSKELEEHFSKLQTQLTDQIDVIKTMVSSIQAKLEDMGEVYSRGNRRPLAAATLKSGCDHTGSSNRRSDGNVTMSTTELDNLLDEEEEKDNTREEGEEQMTYSFRDYEVSMYNSTVHFDTFVESRVFTYYWRIYKIENMLTNWNQHWSLRSPSFYVNNSYKMYLKIFPKQNGDNTYVHVGLTKGDFDEKLAWPFRLKHRVSIMDQTNIAGRADDIVSRIWDPTRLCSATNWQKPVLHKDNYECVGLGFPHSTLRSKSYILHNTILIKLSVFLV